MRVGRCLTRLVNTPLGGAGEGRCLTGVGQSTWQGWGWVRVCLTSLVNHFPPPGEEAFRIDMRLKAV